MIVMGPFKTKFRLIKGPFKTGFTVYDLNGFKNTDYKA
jgi:hypothetical protein